MAKKQKKSVKRRPAPVESGHDHRAREPLNHSSRDPRGGSDAPDGVSGNWS